MTILDVLGFDPGSKTSGWAFLRLTWERAKPVTTSFIECGEVTDDARAVAAVIQRLLPKDVCVHPRIVAIEKPVAYAFKRSGKAGYGSKMVGNLMEARGTSDSIRTVCSMLGFLDVRELAATKVRSAVAGNPQAKDATIKVAILRFVTGWPKVSNSHERDAAAVALYAGWLEAAATGGAFPYLGTGRR